MIYISENDIEKCGLKEVYRFQSLSEVRRDYLYLFTLSPFHKGMSQKGCLPVKVSCFRNKTFLEMNKDSVLKKF
jgi:hypothetical protein